MARIPPTARQQLLQDLLGYVSSARLAADRKIDRTVHARLLDRAAGRPISEEDEQYLTSDLVTVLAAHDALVDWATDLEDLVERQHVAAQEQTEERRQLGERYVEMTGQLHRAQAAHAAEQALTERLIRRLAQVLEERDEYARLASDEDD